MVSKSKTSGMQFHFGTSKAQLAGSRSGENPFKVAILGDFSGRAGRGICHVGSAIANQSIKRIDLDTFEQVLRAFDIRIELPLDAGGQQHNLLLPIQKLDDLHPDQIYRSVALFQELKHLRQRLSDPRTFDAAAVELKSWKASEVLRKKKGSPLGKKIDEKPTDVASKGSLDELLAQPLKKAHTLSLGETTINLDSIIHKLVGPHVVEGPNPRQDEFISLIDDIASILMRSILQNETFKALEAVWRGLSFIVNRIELDESTQIFLVDISKEEFLSDLLAVDQVEETGLYRLLVDNTVGVPGISPWSFLSGVYSFNSSSDDIESLRRMAEIGRACGAPFVGAADLPLIGCKSTGTIANFDDWDLNAKDREQETWNDLRAHPESSRIGLVFPRFLARLPYGNDTDPIEVFEFEEFSMQPDHEDYLWANPVFMLVYVLLDTFSRDGWDLDPNGHTEVDDLPAHFFRIEGESIMKPCAEVWMSERVAGRIREKGIMPLMSIRNRSSIAFKGCCSLSERSKDLSGPWRKQP